jgi:serine kinase of HPr protein (carbohydrate metabolism regulator)
MTPDQTMQRLAEHAAVCLAPDICHECIERRLCIRGVSEQANAMCETGAIVDLVAWERLGEHLNFDRMSSDAEEIRALNVAMWRHADPIREQLAHTAVNKAIQGTHRHSVGFTPRRANDEPPLEAYWGDDKWLKTPELTPSSIRSQN